MNLLKNSLWGVLGIAIPTVIALPSIGFMARALGVEKFGLITLAWALVGYASLFDLGLSRAVSRYVSEHRNNSEQTALALGTALWAVTIAGLIAMGLVCVANPWLLDYVIRVDRAIREDAYWGIMVVSATLPFLLATLVLQGYLEGKGMFGEANFQRVISGSLLAFLPALFVAISSSFLMAMCGMLLARVGTLAFCAHRCNRFQSMSEYRVSKGVFKEYVRFGGWITVSNIIGPMMGYLDRFFLSSLRGAAFVANYTAPAELVSRFAILPIAISRALFPQLVEASGVAAQRTLLFKARLLMLGSCAVVTIATMLYATQILEIWLGKTLSHHAGTILQILMIGFLLNAYAQVPFTALQSIGRSDITAKIHLFEVIPYIVALTYLIKEYGEIGVAVAWTGRIVIDVILLELAYITCRHVNAKNDVSQS